MNRMAMKGAYTLSSTVLAVMLILVGDSLAFVHRASAQGAPSTQWDVEQLDKILAASTANDVQVGDMFFRRAVLQRHRDELAGTSVGPSSATGSGVTLWPGGNVYYTFDPSVSSPHQQHFLDAAGEWTAFANLRFLPRTTQPNYVTVKDVPGLSGGNSYVGMIGGQQHINIGSGSWNRLTLVHELGHALGLSHEHQRSDRDEFVTILTDNIVPGEEGNFVRLPDSINYGAYDFLSSMHYTRNALSIDPATRNTIEPKTAYAGFLDQMGRQVDRPQSKLDRAGMATAYGPPSPAPSGTVTNTNDSGPGSLRVASYYAFDRADHSGGLTTTVRFAIPPTDPGFDGKVATIRPTAVLPAVGNRTIIDGRSQTTAKGNTNPDGPEVVINGSRIVAPELFAAGLVLRGASSTIKDLIVNGFNEDGIQIVGAAATANLVSGSYIGTDVAGASAIPNAYAGIAVTQGAHGNRIGGGGSLRNILSGNGATGTAISGPGTDSNLVRGNYIGLNATGTAALANSVGVAIFDGARSNIVGSATASARNVISGNTQQGVNIANPDTRLNVVMGNFIGTDPTGTTARANTGAGVSIFAGAQSNTVGGTAAGAGNTLSGNARQGLTISDSGTTLNKVLGNRIGLDGAGAGALANGWSGIQVFGGAVSNTIGGTTSAARNFVSGNGNYGVSLSGSGTSSNIVRGNTIGQNQGGGAVANAWGGVVLWGGATANQVGGITTGSGNVITANLSSGVVAFDTTTTGNAIRGNAISANSSLGINLVGGTENAWGVTTNDASDADTGPNGLQNHPVIVSAVNGTTTVVQGTLTSAANKTYRVEFFASPTADPSTYGEGAVYLGFQNVTIGAGASPGTFSFSAPTALPAGHAVTSTATDPAGNTSEFSQRKLVS